jgi:hypothetical protein
MTDSFNMFKSWAEVLLKEDGIDYTEKGSAVIDTMATRYVEALDAGDNRTANKYIAGLMLRFWNNVGKLQMKGSGLNLTYDEYVSWLYEAIEYACKYRAWLNPAKNVNAQQAINQCIETIRRQHYYEFNLDKHRANYNSISIDTPLEGDGNSTLGDTIADSLEGDDHEYLESDLAARSIVQSYITRKKLVEAIILDVIAFNDVEKVTKKVVEGKDPDGTSRKFTQVYKEFWPYRAVQILSTLPATYSDEFGKKYSCNPVEFDKALAAIRSANNQKLYKYLYSTLADAKTSLA